jgi:hypothetical protein
MYACVRARAQSLQLLVRGLEVLPLGEEDKKAVEAHLLRTKAAQVGGVALLWCDLLRNMARGVAGVWSSHAGGS